MIKNQKGFALISLLLISLILILVLCIGWFVLNKNNNVIENKGVSYRIDFPNSKKENRDGISALVSSDGAVVLSVTPSSTNKRIECTVKVKKIADIDINGAVYDLCQAENSQIYIVSFSNQNKWHVVTILSPTNTVIPIDEIKSLVSDIKIL